MRLSVAALADRAELHLLAGAQDRGVGGLAAALLPRLREGLARAQVETTLDRMRGRQGLLGARYPFGAEAEVTVPRAGSQVYRDLLMLSLAGGRHPEQAAAALDQIVGHALRVIVPGPSVVVSFAHPARGVEDPRPAGFPEAVTWLGKRLGLRTGTGYRSPARQDGGVDLVAVQRLAGSSLAAAAYLVQTTVSTDLRTKAREVDVDLWRRWIDLSPQTQRVLAVPHEVEREDLEELHASGVIVLDRVRLAELLAARDDELLDVAGRIWAETTWQGLLSAERESW